LGAGSLLLCERRAREELGWDNLDIKQSFPTELANVGEQRADWAATYTEAHGPTK